MNGLLRRLKTQSLTSVDLSFPKWQDLPDKFYCPLEESNQLNRQKCRIRRNYLRWLRIRHDYLKKNNCNWFRLRIYWLWSYFVSGRSGSPFGSMKNRSSWISLSLARRTAIVSSWFREDSFSMKERVAALNSSTDCLKYSFKIRNLNNHEDFNNVLHANT